MASQNLHKPVETAWVLTTETAPLDYSYTNDPGSMRAGAGLQVGAWGVIGGRMT